MQCKKSKKWDRQGEIIDVRPDGLSYLIDFEGKVIVRGRALLKPVFESGNGQDQGHVDQEEGEFSSPDIPSSSSDASSSPRRSRRLQEKWSSSPAQVVTATVTPPRSGSSRRCSGCTDNRQRTLKTRLISPLGGSPSTISSGHPLPLEPPPSSCAPSCSLLSSSVAGLGRRTFAGPRDPIPSSWMSSTAERTPFLNPTSVPVQDLPGPLLPLWPPINGCAPPLGGPPFPRPTSFQPPLSTGSHSCPILSSHPLSTTVDTTHSANVGFLAAAGNTRVAQNFSPIVPGLNWSSGNRGSPSLTPPQTPSSAGLRVTKTTSVNLPERLPVRLPLSPPSATALPVLSPVRVLAGPPTRTLLLPRSPCTSQKKASVPLREQKIGKVRPGLVSTPSESRLLPHSSLKDYNTVSLHRPGSVYGLRVVFWC